jgi:hypothetical protein
MKLKLLLALIFVASFLGCQQKIGSDSEAVINLNFEQNETVTYYEAIEAYQTLADHYPQAKLLSYGLTDAGKPLHLFVMSKDRDFNTESIREDGKSIVLINNGIHPGEPEGIDASIIFADDVLRNKDGMSALLDHSVVCIIPVYNVGGCLNRSAFHRTGQTTPKECGYRGNAKNLDLNRDFVKLDTKNAQAFTTIFKEWDPDVFLDTHTTNGSDHKYVITLIPFQPSGLPADLGDFFRNKMIPHLYDQMATTDYELIPYVNYMNNSPKSGISLDAQTPRFSTGYAGLFNTLGFMTENHIYKDFSDRVRSVYVFIQFMTAFANENAGEIIQLRKDANEQTSRQKEFALDWQLDTTKFEMIRFKGYEGEMGISPVTGLERFGYYQDKPYDTMVPFYDYHLPKNIVVAPKYYILPQAWEEVAERLELNKVKMNRLAKDTAFEVERYYITDFETSKWQNNWHRYHNKVELDPKMETIQFYEGDYIIPMDQEANKYIVEMLEPEGQDSFFRWNFFDPCLESREYYSSYGFEENALKYLAENPEFRKEFEEAVKTDSELAKNHRAQLGYIYNNTEWADNRVGRYPVVRVNRETKLPVK